ncbi:hypothetical protein KI082_001788 [Escherichia coli]|nr:hypothetical protein [Escherichia coli]
MVDCKENAYMDGMRDAELAVAWKLLMCRCFSTMSIEILSNASPGDFLMLLMTRHKQEIAWALQNENFSEEKICHIAQISPAEINAPYRPRYTRKQYMREVATRLREEGVSRPDICRMTTLGAELLSDDNWQCYEEHYAKGYTDALYETVWRMDKAKYCTSTVHQITGLSLQEIGRVLSKCEFLCRARQLAKNDDDFEAFKSACELSDSVISTVLRG